MGLLRLLNRISWISRLSIRTKLLVGLSLFGALAVATTSWIGYFNAKRSLTAAAMQQLTGIRRSRAYHVESYFRTVRNQALTWSEDPLFVSALISFADAFRLESKPQPPDVISAVQDYYTDIFYPRLKRYVPARSRPDDYFPATQEAYRAQYSFISKNPYPREERDKLDTPSVPGIYAKVHSQFHPRLRKFARAFGYYDLMLVDAQSRIVYSVSKQSDYGTNLIVGPYRTTALAKVVGKCLAAPNNADVIFSDFEPYDPSLGAPAIFVCSPIADERGRLGVLALQLSNAEFDRVVSGNHGWSRDGLGESGDCGIVGPDYLMRTTARTFAESPDKHLAVMRERGVPEQKLQTMKAYGTTILQQEVRLPSVTLALEGKEGTIEQVSSSGRVSFVSYMPLRIEGLHWTLAARMDAQEALRGADDLKRQSILWSLPLLGLACLFALSITHAVVKPVLRLADGAEKVRAGDLTVQLPITSKDELGSLTNSFNGMVSGLRVKSEALEQKNRENELLLLNILPGEIADRLKGGEGTIADSFADVTVLFADLVGFTVMSSNVGAAEVVSRLNGLFTRFDEIAASLEVEKIKTIGDAYMAVCGLPRPQADHTERILQMAIRMLEATRSYSRAIGIPLDLRIGINSGPVVAGVIGATKFIYDLWGDTVNIASRMESHGVPGSIQVTRSVYDKLKGSYAFNPRGTIDIKGKGMIETWLFVGSPTSAAPDNPARIDPA
jgi:class 3 adenylate cyclase